MKLSIFLLVISFILHCVAHAYAADGHDVKEGEVLTQVHFPFQDGTVSALRHLTLRSKQCTFVSYHTHPTYLTFDSTST